MVPVSVIEVLLAIRLTLATAETKPAIAIAVPSNPTAPALTVCPDAIVSSPPLDRETVCGIETEPVTVSAEPSTRVSELPAAAPVNEPRLTIWFAVAELPDRLAIPFLPTDPDSVPAMIVPVLSLMPLSRDEISETVPAPPSVTTPSITMPPPDSATAVPDSVCKALIVIDPVSVTLTDPVSETVLTIVRFGLLSSVRLAPVIEPRLTMLFVVAVEPRRLMAATADPLSVPAISVPDSVIDPTLANNATVPAPPSVRSPVIEILGAVRLTAAADSVLPTVSGVASFSVKPVAENDPIEPMRLAPDRLTVVAALPPNVPVVMIPAPLIVPTLVSNDTAPVAVPPVVIGPEMVRLSADNVTPGADKVPATVSAPVSVRLKLCPVPVTVNAPIVPMPPALLVSATDPPATVPVSVETLMKA